MRSSCKAVILVLCIAVTVFSCNKNANQPGATSQANSSKRYHLKGKVVSVDKRANMANIDGEDVPGFMSAMTMPYLVKPSSELDKLAPGDAITADIVVQGDNSWLENVVVIEHPSTSAK